MKGYFLLLVVIVTVAGTDLPTRLKKGPRPPKRHPALPPTKTKSGPPPPPHGAPGMAHPAVLSRPGKPPGYAVVFPGHAVPPAGPAVSRTGPAAPPAGPAVPPGVPPPGAVYPPLTKTKKGAPPRLLGGAAKTPPCRFVPVCGSDGFTYMSECFLLTSRGVTKECDDFCPCPSPPANIYPPYQPTPPQPKKPVRSPFTPYYPRRQPVKPYPPTPVCACPYQYAPVCAVNDDSFDNDCQRRCSGVAKACEGKCPCQTPPPTTTTPAPRLCLSYCSYTHKPVCSVWGHTFGNKCILQCSGEAKACEGKCPCLLPQPPPPPTTTTPAPRPCLSYCSYTYKPVCSAWGNTFGNKCILQCSGESKACEGQCPCLSPLPPPTTTTSAPRPCLSYCSYTYKPVCSAWGNTFSNKCILQCSGEEKACEGECPCLSPPPPAPTTTTTPAPRPCLSYCSYTYKPVCSAWGNTFSNKCILQCSGEGKACEGECPCLSPQPPPTSTTPAIRPRLSYCSYTYKPVCSAWGNTFTNKCILQLTNLTPVRERVRVSPIVTGPSLQPPTTVGVRQMISTLCARPTVRRNGTDVKPFARVKTSPVLPSVRVNVTLDDGRHNEDNEPLIGTDIYTLYDTGLL